jgi:hypothetical protein
MKNDTLGDEALGNVRPRDAKAGRPTYKVATAQSIDSLQTRVEQAIIEGYVPTGGVAAWKSVTPEYYGNMFAQALVIPPTIRNHVRIEP